MSKKLQNIIEIANQANAADLIEIWTNSYIARGSLLKDTDRTFEGVVTLMGVEIYPILSECECSDGKIDREWLNIFEDQIISFTVIKPEKK